jgi:hypothetical protein
MASLSAVQHAGANGSFRPFDGVPDQPLGGLAVTGQRYCPNPECRAHVFVV